MPENGNRGNDVSKKDRHIIAAEMIVGETTVIETMTGVARDPVAGSEEMNGVIPLTRIVAAEREDTTTMRVVVAIVILTLIEIEIEEMVTEGIGEAAIAIAKTIDTWTCLLHRLARLSFRQM